MLVIAASTYKEAPNNPPALQIEEAEIYEQIILDGSPRSNHSTVAEVGNLQVVEKSTQCHQHFGSKRLDKLEIATNLENMDDEAQAGLFDLWVERGYLKETAVDGALGKDWFHAHYPSLHAVYPQSPNFSSDKSLAADFGAKVAANSWWLAYVERMSRIGSLQNITYSVGVINALWSLVNKLKVPQERRFDVRVPQGKLRHLIHGLMRDFPVPIDIPIAPDENAMQQHLQAVKGLGEALGANERQHNEYKAREVALQDELDRVLVTLGTLEDNRMCLWTTLAVEQLAATTLPRRRKSILVPRRLEKSW